MLYLELLASNCSWLDNYKKKSLMHRSFITIFIIRICHVCIVCIRCRSVSHCLLESLCVPLWSCSQGFLSRLSDFLLCRWSCRSCWQWCWECSCCQPTDEEVEILGPFPAQTPSWLWVHTHTTLIQPTNNVHTSQITQNNSSFISSVYSLIITVRLKLRQTETEYTVLLNKSQDNPNGTICQRLIVDDGWCVLVMFGMEY